MNDLEVLSNDLAQAVLLARLAVLPLDWGVWPLARRFGWLSSILASTEQELLREVSV